jgi:hypothetical protein
LSLTVTLKFIVLVTEGTTSHVGVIPAARSGRFGKYLVGSATGILDLKLGPSVDVATGGCVDGVLSICSQQYSNTSPSGSVTVAVRAKGVFAGTVTLPFVAVIVGAVLVKDVIASQVWPPDIISS